MFWHQPSLSFINAKLPHHAITTLGIVGDRIRAIGESPRRSDTVVDLNGAWLLPGLINAHDHLELNNFPRLKWRERYDNAYDWIADFQPRFKTDPQLCKPQAVPLADRLFIGGLKNLLSGVTTVAHHNPLHSALRRHDFPVRVVQRFGWAHSLGIDGDGKVSAAFRRTPRSWPWLIHLAEGCDARAAAELQKLEHLDCLKANTLIVHGVGLSEFDQHLLYAANAGLIWCPSSNLFMLGRTAVVSELARLGRVALGSDSRLSGERDLLAEVRVARGCQQVNEQTLWSLVTTNAARLLRLPQVGELRVGALADLLVLPPSDSPLLNADGQARTRGDVQLVMVGGRARCADESFAQTFAVHGAHGERVQVDDRAKLLARALAERLRRCSIPEPGVVV